MTSYELMPANSRVWIYQSNLPFTEEEVPEIKEQVKKVLRGEGQVRNIEEKAKKEGGKEGEAEGGSFTL